MRKTRPAPAGPENPISQRLSRAGRGLRVAAYGAIASAVPSSVLGGRGGSGFASADWGRRMVGRFQGCTPGRRGGLRDAPTDAWAAFRGRIEARRDVFRHEKTARCRTKRLPCLDTEVGGEGPGPRMGQGGAESLEAGTTVTTVVDSSDEDR